MDLGEHIPGKLWISLKEIYNKIIAFKNKKLKSELLDRLKPEKLGVKSEKSDNNWLKMETS